MVSRGRQRTQPGLEPQASGGISHLSILRNNERSLLCLPSGDVDASVEPAAGLYFRDARHLSRMSFTINGERPLVLDSDERGYSLSATLTNAPFNTADGTPVPGQSILIRRSRVLGDCLADGLAISNYGRRPVALELEFRLEADFTDIFVIRGHERTSPVPPVAVEREGDRLSFRYMGADGQLRATTCVFSPPPTNVTAEGLTFSFSLDPGGTYSLGLTVHTDGSTEFVHAEDALAAADAKARSWLKGLTLLETDNAALNAALQRCLLDIRSLEGTLGQHRSMAAGVPWFDAPFGRDSIITGIELAAFTPEPLKDAIELLAEHQAHRRDPARDAEPGKIAHELRQGELANIGEVPFGSYYGSIDSTPLFLIGCLEYLRWTDDSETLERCWPAIERAAGWCHARAAAHPLHLLAYDRESANGLEHQGWKDSEDGVCHVDGTPVAPPVALIEVQAYLAAAHVAFGELASRLGKRPAFDPGAAAADALRHLRERFLAGEEPAVCLDRDLEPVSCPTSNPGHVLWVGAADGEQAKRVADRLLEADMFSGWGVRTLAAGIPAYNPLGYHIGSIWPHDNALILAGFRRYGLVDQLRTLGTGLVEAALSFPDRRVPELFSGDARGARPVPTPYPVASRPQAWSAASLPSALVSLLGIGVSTDGSLCITRPVLPDGVSLVVVRGLRFGSSSVDLLFRGHENHVSVEVDRRSGNGSVVLAPEWPIPPLEWRLSR